LLGTTIAKKILREIKTRWKEDYQEQITERLKLVFIQYITELLLDAIDLANSHTNTIEHFE
jgi:hypothetical protein